ncbi:hypothetical protein LCGC14_0956770, partial [marine sediment metagenome]
FITAKTPLLAEFSSTTFYFKKLLAAASASQRPNRREREV